MGMLDSIFGKSEAPAPAASEAPAPTPAGAPTTVIPEAPEAPTEPVAGMDQFKDLWENAPEDPKKASDQPNFEVDQAKLMAEVSKVDFTQVVTPEIMTKVTEGGEGAMQAMMQAMNLMSQATYAQSAAAATAITKAAYARAESNLDQRIQATIASTSVNEGVAGQDSMLSHKAAKPLIQALNTQIATKFPNATSSERIAMAQQYLKEFASIANPVAPVAPVEVETDWGEFAGIG